MRADRIYIFSRCTVNNPAFILVIQYILCDITVLFFRCLDCKIQVFAVKACDEYRWIKKPKHTDHVFFDFFCRCRRKRAYNRASVQTADKLYDL